jgi:purine-binding chemotaxis protein CheW
MTSAELPQGQAAPDLPATAGAALSGSTSILASSMMPTDEISRRVLRERAQVLATVAVVEDEETVDQFLRFRLGLVERYGIPYTFLQELLHVGNLARVPCTPASIAGVVNHRGELLTVIDLKHFFRIEPIPMSNETRIVVVQHGTIRTGILVDEVDGNEQYRVSDLAPPLSSEGVSNMEHVLGIHKGNVTMLNIDALLSDPALLVGKPS